MQTVSAQFYSIDFQVIEIGQSATDQLEEIWQSVIAKFQAAGFQAIQIGQTVSGQFE
mgnify:CR=1 FL=1